MVLNLGSSKIIIRFYIYIYIYVLGYPRDDAFKYSNIMTFCTVIDG